MKAFEAAVEAITCAVSTLDLVVRRVLYDAKHDSSRYGPGDQNRSEIEYCGFERRRRAFRETHAVLVLVDSFRKAQ